MYYSKSDLLQLEPFSVLDILRLTFARTAL